jgi:hypothetical protein
MKITRKQEDADGNATEVPIHINRVMNIPDEAQIKQQKRAAEDEAEAKRDKTFNEFQEMYLDHIEGKIDPQTRVGDRPESANPDEAKSRKGDDDVGHSSKKPVSLSRTLIMIVKIFGNKYALPDSCKMEMLKASRIDKLDEDYTLVAHPFPQFDGEMILFQVDSADQEDMDIIVYKDFSLRKRNPTTLTKAKMSIAQKTQQ